MYVIDHAGVGSPEGLSAQLHTLRGSLERWQPERARIVPTPAEYCHRSNEGWWLAAHTCVLQCVGCRNCMCPGMMLPRQAQDTGRHETDTRSLSNRIAGARRRFCPELRRSSDRLEFNGAQAFGRSEAVWRSFHIELCLNFRNLAVTTSLLLVVVATTRSTSRSDHSGSGSKSKSVKQRCGSATMTVRHKTIQQRYYTNI